MIKQLMELQQQQQQNWNQIYITGDIISEKNPPFYCQCSLQKSQFSPQCSQGTR